MARMQEHPSPAANADADAPRAKRARTDEKGDASLSSSNKKASPSPSPAASPPANLYSGFTVPVDGFELERIDVNQLTPQEFFERYVATRTPVVLKGFISDEAFKAPQRWSNEYLEATAGDERLQVEQRDTSAAKFGQGIEVDMTFKELLGLIRGGDDRHYLTTQDVEADEDGRPEIMAPFVRKLQQDFPLRPALLGHLVPQNINIWMGNNKHGSSTGLHHDYHDNLYILLRGKKRFRLYSPADTEKMYTRGKLLKVHSNGRINYEGEETTAYGADPMSEAAAWAEREKTVAEEELALAEQAVERGEEGAQERLMAAEEKLDIAMLALLRADREDPEDEEEPEDGEFGPFHFDSEDGDDDDESEADEGDDGEDDEDESSIDSASRGKSLAKRVDKTVKNPDNFSLVDTTQLKDETTRSKLFEKFPGFQYAKAAFCELEVGEMLFLPASWFHEVESFGSAEGHLALNYWYHPPDAFECFETPYSSSFWSQDWELREK